MPRQITDEELRAYLLKQKAPVADDQSAQAALKNYLGVTPENANEPLPTPDVSDQPQENFLTSDNVPTPKEISEQTAGETFDAQLKAKKPDLFKSQNEGLSAEEADKKIMGEAPAPQSDATPSGQVMSSQEFDDTLAMKKPALFDHPHMGMSAEAADKMIMEGTEPERLVAPPPPVLGHEEGQAPATESMDVPHAQAQAAAEEKHADVPLEGHTDDLLKSTDERKVDQKVADEKLQSTDPLAYIKKKFGLDNLEGVDELKAAQKSERFDRAMADLGEGLLESGYLAKNMQMPESQRKYYAGLRNEAKLPGEQLGERNKLTTAKIGMADKMFDMATKDFDITRKQKLATAGTPESLTINGMLARFLPDDMKDMESELKKMSALDAKEYIDSALLKKSQYDAQKAYKSSVAGDRAERNVDKDFMKFGDRLEGGIASSRTAMGRDSNNVRQGGAILALIRQVEETQNYKPDNRQIFEVARSLDQMLAQGTGTIAGTKELVPHTFTQKIANLKEFLQGKPSNAEIQDFLKRTKESVLREIQFSQKDLTGIKNRLTAGYTHLHKKDPDRFADIVRKHGLDIDDSGEISVPEISRPASEVMAPKAPTTAAPVAAQFKAGDRRQKGDKWYVRNEQGQWLPE